MKYYATSDLHRLYTPLRKTLLHAEYSDTHEVIVCDELIHAVQEERLCRSHSSKKTLAMNMTL